MKKILFTFLLLAAAINAYSNNYDFAALAPSGQALYYIITSSTTVEVTDPSDRSYESWHGHSKPVGNLVIPSSVTHDGVTYTVSSIGEEAFWECTSLNSITIPSSVTSIGDDFIRYCLNLNSIVVESGNTHYDSRLNCNAIIETATNKIIFGCKNSFIPNSVTCIGQKAFMGCRKLTAITIPNSVTTIEPYGFSNCGIVSINIPNSVTQIGDWAFYSCDSLSSVSIPNTIISLPGCVFQHTNLETIEIPSSVTSIGGAAFANCRRLTSITIPNSVTSIGSQVFYNCTNLSSVTISNSVTSIGNQAFYGCTSLSSVTIPNSVNRIEYKTFYGCSGITSVTIPNTVTYIGSEAFYGCSGLTSITIPNSVTSIGTSTFKNCSSLTTVTIPNSVTSIGNEAFYNCTGLLSVTIPNSVTSIGTSAFRNCTRLDYVVVPSSVTTIGANAFSGVNTLLYGGTATGSPWGANQVIYLANMSMIENGFVYSDYEKTTLIGYIGSALAITIPSTVTTIASDAFDGMSNLISVTISDNVTTIGQNAFRNCLGIDSLYIGSGVTTIGDNAFQGCTGIQYINYNAKNNTRSLFYGTNAPFNNTSTPNFTTLVIGDSVQTIPSSCFQNRTSIENLQIGDSVTSIESSAFSGCTGLSSINIPNSVTIIKGSAFSGCTGIDSLFLGSGLTTINGSAFQGCSNVKYIYYNASNNTSGLFVSSSGAFYSTSTPYFTTLVIGDSVRAIPNNCFYNRSSLENVQFGDNVTTIGDLAFYGCSGIDSLYLGSSVTSIGETAFGSCTGLTDVFFPNSLITIGGSAFSNCSNITSLNLPNSPLTIGNGAFRDCSGVATLVIPDSVTSISAETFRGCSGIDSLYLGCGITTIGDFAFQGCSGIKYIFYNAANNNTGLFGTSGNSPFYNTDVPNFTTLVIGDSVRSIPSYCFYNRTSINNFQMRNGVTSIGSYAFHGCNNILSLSIPNTTAQINDFAFAYCRKLHTVDIPGSVQTIEHHAFYYCDSLNHISLGDGLLSIGDYAFDQASIRKLMIPQSVTNVGASAFHSCRNMDSLFINCTVATIGSGAFSNCDSLCYIYFNLKNPQTLNFNGGSNSTIYGSTQKLETITTGDSVQVIPSSFFRGKSKIKRVYLGKNVKSINYNAFYECSGLLSINIPENIDSIHTRAFRGCTKLYSIRIPGNTKYIGNEAFYNCVALDSMYFSSGVNSLGNDAFHGCTGVKYLHYNNNHIPMDFRNGYGLLPSYDSLRTLVIGDSVTTIPNCLLYGRTDIDSVHIGNNVASIGDSAFFGCSSIRDIMIPNSTTYIGKKAFYGCSGIHSMQIGNSVVSIDDSAFFGCSGIRDITIPNSTTHIGESAFYGCSSIDSLHIGDGLTTIGNNVFQGCSSIHDLVIPNNITSIGNNAFYGCAGIENLSLGNGVESIGNNTFKGCSGFTKLAIPASVTSIGSNAFYGCTSIDSLYIGSGVQTIGSGAFRGCTGLQWLDYNAPNLPAQGFYGCTQLATLILGNTVQSIGNEAFYDCDNLLTATVNASQIGENAFANCDRLVSVTLGDSTTTLGSGAFSGCFRLQNINLGGITSIGDNAFNGCVRLENPELPAALTTIGTRAFNGCSLLAGKLTFPASITSIGDYAYSGIGTITEIEMLGATPPTIYAHTFASLSNSTPVVVPCGAVMNYYITNYWENFSNIVETTPYELQVNSNSDVMGEAAVIQLPSCSNPTAIIQATAEEGFHFLQWSDGNGTNPRTIQMTQDSTFTAIFVPNNSYIVVEPNDPTMGTTSGTGTYGYNAPVTMTATAYSGYHFLKWNDGNTQNPRYMAATRDTTFTAIFVSNVSTITVTNANPEWGNVGGSGVYYYQNLVSLTATPNYGYHFSQWNDGNTQNPRTITVMQDSSFTAYFAVNTYSIVATSNSTTMGSVSGGGTYTYLHEMSLTATPAYGYHFVQWNDQNTDNPRTITVTRDSAFTAQFAANSYNITAEPNDPTMGSAYGSGTFNFNTTATLTAVAEYGYHFTQWSDGVTDNPRTITVQNSATYTAQFEINSYILTVQSSNPAIGTTSGGGSYNYLTPVNITAIPNDGYHFTQWSDGNTDNPRLVSVTQNATYTAQFAINSYAVSVTCNNSSMGSVSGSGTYNHNNTATLTATAYYGYHFVQWQDGNTENPRTVVVTDSTQYTAQFDFNSYLITANSSNVTLGSAIGGGSYNYLSQVALTAVPVPHYHFTMWNDSIEDNPRTITVTRDSIFTAHFAIDRHTIGVHTADATLGTVSGSDTVDYNTAVWISATANYGYHFTQWNDSSTSNPRRVVVSQDTVFTASFAPNQYSATCAVNDNSRGTVASTGGNYNYLTSVTFTAIPNSDYHFLRWSNGSTENPVTFTLTKDTVLTAILVGLTANVNDNTMGSVSHSKPSNLVEVVTATPNYGYHFTQWSDGNTDNPRTVTLTGDTMLTAFFAVNNYYLTLASNDSTLGSVQGEGEYAYLSNVTITAIAAEHSHFVQWSDGNTTNPRMLTVTRDTSFMAYFAPDQQFQITVGANDTMMGSVEGGGMYYLGETVSIMATANEHYYFAQWSDGVTSNPRVITVTGDMTYTAVFEPVMYTLTVAANDYSMGQVTGGGSYAYGTEVTIEARAFGGYRFLGWNDGVMDEQRTVTVTADATYTAIFEQNAGIEDVENASYKVYVSNGHIVVEGVEEKRVQVYDLTGRKHSLSEQLPTGVYMVRIDNKVTKKVVVR